MAMALRRRMQCGGLWLSVHGCSIEEDTRLTAYDRQLLLTRHDPLRFLWEALGADQETDFLRMSDRLLARETMEGAVATTGSPRGRSRSAPPSA